MIILIAFALAGFAGFAAQRGSICVVAAMTDLVVRRSARRYLAFLEAGLWSLATAGALSFFVDAAPVVSHSVTALVALGGVFFGLGACVNGACAFGSAARLARGEADFAFMPAGLVVGAATMARFAAEPASIPALAPSSPALTMFLVVFACWRLMGALDRLRSAPALRASLLAPRWSQSAAMAAVGVASAALMAVYAPWPYSNLLVDLARGEGVADGPRRALVVLMFLAGATAAARAAGDFRMRRPTLPGALRSFAGGTLMGAGSHLIPGGNDALVLHALPNFLAYGLVAYATMSLTIAIIVLLGRKRFSNAQGEGSRK